MASIIKNQILKHFSSFLMLMWFDFLMVYFGHFIVTKELKMILIIAAYIALSFYILMHIKVEKVEKKKYGFAKNVSPDQISVEVLRGKGELYNIELNEDVLTDVLEFPSWIPWTRLKTHPVLLFIDEVRVELVLSAGIHHAKFTNGPTVSSYSMDNSSYGFAHRVMEGITIRCNAVEVFFTSQKFGGSLMLSQISVESRTPFWKEANDLRETRITDSHSKQILLFKQISWKTLRLEASTLGDSIATGYNINAPLRLITSQGRCRFITKKSTIDGSVFRGRLALILDNLLWVASLSQVQSAISFFHFVMDLIRQSNGTMTTEINKVAIDNPTRRASSASQQHQQYEQQQLPSETNAAFQQFNVVETSFHCYIAHIDLHICDESKEEGGESSEDLLIENGAMQVTLKKLVCDFYPYHPTGGSRKHWIYYQETMFSERTNDLLKKYKEIIETEFSSSNPSSSKHKTEKFLSTDRAVMKLPSDTPTLHVELTDFYTKQRAHYPGTKTFTLLYIYLSSIPPSSSFLRLHPVRVFLDLRTIRWINYVFLKVNQSLSSDSYTNEAMKNALHKDIYMDVMMPRVIVPLMGAPDVDWLQKVPTSMVLYSSRICLTNCLPDHSDTSHQLQQLVTEIEEQEMPIQADDWDASLPSNSQAYSTHVRRLIPKLHNNRAGKDCKTDASTLVEKATVDVWRIDCTPLWLEFQGKACQYPAARPLMFDCNFTVWLMMDKKGDNENILYSLADTVDPVKICLDHYQYLFVTYAMDEMSRFSQTLYEDTLRFTVDYEPAVCFVHFQAPSIELHLLLPPNGPLTVYDNEKLSAQSVVHSLTIILYNLHNANCLQGNIMCTQMKFVKLSHNSILQFIGLNCTPKNGSELNGNGGAALAVSLELNVSGESGSAWVGCSARVVVACCLTVSNGRLRGCSPPASMFISIRSIGRTGWAFKLFTSTCSNGFRSVGLNCCRNDGCEPWNVETGRRSVDHCAFNVSGGGLCRIGGRKFRAFSGMICFTGDNCVVLHLPKRMINVVNRQFSKLKLAETVDTVGVKSFWDETESSSRSTTFREICQNDADSSPTDDHSVDQACKFESDAAYSYEESGSIVTNFSNDDDDEETFIVVDHKEHSLFDEIFSIFNSATVSLAEEVVDSAQNSDLIQKMSNQMMCAVKFTFHKLRLRMSLIGLLYRIDMCSPVITVKDIEKIPYRDFYKLFSQKENDEPTLMTTVENSTSEYSLNVTIKNEQINLNLCLVEANVSNVQMHLSSDNLANLSAFVQDYSSTDQLSQMRVKLCLKNVQLSIFDPRIPDPVYILLDSGCILQGQWRKMAISTLKQLKRKSEEIETLRKENATLKKKLDEALRTIENANKK
ncbi:UHRF1-binding protein 1-like [Trichinella murrelli]|uniref:UHRF1-binding protein 1-like n=1 Tax=Trichinella murrelli TaxID=144512 RepID=A0A0V0U8V5_9BILA|nr:UHRF1-binding protein 1-like [Trichinella murrelli]